MGFKFSVHPLYILLGFVLTALGEGYSFIVYTAVLILHELGHSYAAERRGYALTELSLMPYGAVLRGAFAGVKERDEIFIAAAGPLTNVIFGIIFIAIWWLIPATYFFTEMFVLASLVTAGFNLLPIYPLDGGRVLLAVLKLKKPLNSALKISNIIGIISAGIFMILCIAALILSYNITFAIIGGFVFFSSLFRANTGEYTRLYNSVARRELLIKGMEKREYALSTESRLIDCMRLAQKDCIISIILIDNGVEKMRINEERLEQLYLKYPPNTQFKNISELNA